MFPYSDLLSDNSQTSYPADVSQCVLGGPDAASSPTPSTVPTTIRSCQDTNGMALDSDGDSCGIYNVSFEGFTGKTCGSFDDSDFKANLQCCNCGGGTLYKHKLNSYDYVTFGVTAFAASFTMLAIHYI